MKSTFFFSLLILLISFNSCKSKQGGTDSKDIGNFKNKEEMWAEMSKDMCPCFDGINELIQKMETSEGDEKLALQTEYNSKLMGLNDCVGKHKEKYPSLDYVTVGHSEDVELRKRCPEFEKFMIYMEQKRKN